MRFLGVVLMGSLISGCAATYKAPTLNVIDHSVVTDDTAGSLNAIKRELLVRGYTLTNAGDGVVSTLPKRVKLTTDYATCGKTMGIDYLLDDRTITTVAVNVISDNGRIKVITDIQGEYLKGNVTAGITMQCISRGVIEGELLGLAVK